MQPHPRDIQRIARDGLRKCAFIHRQRTPARGKEQDKDQRAFHAQTVGESRGTIKGNFRGDGGGVRVRDGCVRGGQGHMGRVTRGGRGRVGYHPPYVGWVQPTKAPSPHKPDNYWM